MRTISGVMLAAAVGLAAGCGGSNSNPPAEPKTPLAGDPNKPAPTPTDDPGKSAPPAPAAWEMDPAKHAVPAAPATGKLAGEAFTPEAQFQGDTLSFRVHKDGNPEREVLVKLSPDRAKTVAAGLKLTVRPDQPPGADVPELMTLFPPGKPGAPTAAGFVNGYALTLEFGKREREKLPGKVYLSLPGDEKDFLAGTFTAECAASPSDPPGPDDAPFVQGKVTVAGLPDPQVKVGYAAQPKPEEFAFDIVQLQLVGPGRWARSDHAKPRVTILAGADAADKPARYEHTRLPPGRYLVYAAVVDGPAVWKWVAVAPDAQLTVDLALDAAKVGRLEARVPAGTTGKVQLAPADEPGMPIPSGLVPVVAFNLGLEAEVKDGVATFGKLGPGRYEVRAGDLTDTVEVKPGETAKVELKKK